MKRWQLHTRVTDTCIVDLDSNLVRLGRGNLDILNGELFSRLPRHGGLAGDGLMFSNRLSIFCCSRANRGGGLFHGGVIFIFRIALPFRQ